MDEVHVAFAHQPGGSHAKLSADLPIITAEETDWGMLRFGTRKSGKVRQTLHYAPNLDARDRAAACRHGRRRRLDRNLFQLHAGR